jgi:hypothetical protein
MRRELETSNEFSPEALSAMAKKIPDTPMVMQPVAHDLTAATPMLPTMPTAGSVAKVPARKNAPKRQPTRTEAEQTAKANITRRNSLKKQRQAQRKSG